MPLRAFVTTIEIAPDGTFRGDAITQLDLIGGTKLGLTGRVRSEGSRVWIEVRAHIIERHLRAKSEQRISQGAN
jgi:hypothetical protein